jgi:hypothetical protein
MTTPDPPPRTADAVAWVRTVAEPIARQLAEGHEVHGRATKGRRTPPLGASIGLNVGPHVPRAQAHSLLELLIDLGDAAIRLAGEVVVNLVRVGREVVLAATGGDSVVAGVLSLGQVAAGQAVSGMLDITNVTTEPFDAVRLRCSGLVGEGAERIAASWIDIAPRQLDVQPGTTTPIAVTVRVPPRARRSSYTGVVEVVGRPEVHTLVSLDVL